LFTVRRIIGRQVAMNLVTEQMECSY
jgi:hypothetical protein